MPKGAGLIKSEIVLAPKGTSQNFIKISGMIAGPYLWVKPGANPMQELWCKFTHPLSKLDHFRVAGKMFMRVAY